MSGRVLILGASGRFGRNAAEAFWNHGWTVKIFDRERDDLNELAKDADVIVNAWNPPYPDWAAQVPRLTAQVIEAAKVNDATVIIPGNVYVYGHDNGVVWSNETPHLATNPLGRIRIEMEAAYRDAGVKTIILRAGDYIDSEASGNWFDKVITKKVQKGTFSAPGPMNVPHAWSWLPDVARAAVQLPIVATRLATSRRFCFLVTRCHWPNSKIWSNARPAKSKRPAGCRGGRFAWRHRFGLWAST